MKKTILVLLMVVMVATPCFAQELEPDGIFSIEGTLWEGDIERYPEVIERVEFLQVGFFQGKLYVKNRTGCTFYMSSAYKDFLILSLCKFFAEGDRNDYSEGTVILFPFLGIGFLTDTENNGYEELTLTVPLKKITDSWIPNTDCSAFLE